MVGTGGVEASATGIAAMMDPAIYTLDAAGAATLLSATIAEDLQFSPSGVLHVANATGIHSVSAAGALTNILSDPTSQFAFESSSSLVTTCGDSHAGVFGKGTHRFDLGTGVGTSILGDGGEDIHVDAAGMVTLCGQGGVGELSAPNSLSWIYQGTKAFNFGITTAGDIYIGNQAQYDQQTWPQGLYALTRISHQTLAHAWDPRRFRGVLPPAALQYARYTFSGFRSAPPRNHSSLPARRSESGEKCGLIPVFARLRPALDGPRRRWRRPFGLELTPPALRPRSFPATPIARQYRAGCRRTLGIAAGDTTATQVDTSDINAMTLYERCE